MILKSILREKELPVDITTTIESDQPNYDPIIAKLQQNTKNINKHFSLNYREYRPFLDTLLNDLKTRLSRQKAVLYDSIEELIAKYANTPEKVQEMLVLAKQKATELVEKDKQDKLRLASRKKGAIKSF